MPYFKIGELDILPVMAEKGFKWTENDIDSPDAGRTLDGIMHRGKVTTKGKAEIQFIPIRGEQAARVIQACSLEYVTVETDILPWRGVPTVMEMYNSSRPIEIPIFEDGVAVYDGMKINLIER